MGATPGAIPRGAANQTAESDPGAQLVSRLYQERRGEGRRVPDTLDLQDNGVLAVWAITSGLDPSAEYRPWFSIYFDRRPLCMRHHLPSEIDVIGKYAECITLMRLMTGSKLNEELDAKIWEFIDGHTREDGLFYADIKAPGAQLADPYAQARVLLARICRYELRPDPILAAQIERTIASMVERKMTRGFGFGPLLPACRWYQLMGSEKALELARLDFEALDRGNIFADDGSFGGHFHYHIGAAIGLLAYALMTHDQALVQKICRAYEFARSKGTNYGYFPECVPPAPWVMLISNEGCCTADMTSLAAALSRSGAGDYWDDLDRYLRNQLTEMQMKRTDFMDRIPDENKVPIAIRPERGETQLDDMTRFIGCFAGWAAPNDFAGPAHFWIQQCCLGNGPRALYQGWENIVTPTASGLRINLLLNRSTPEIDVDSYLPSEGKVGIFIKKRTAIAVRIPGWLDLRQVKARASEGVLRTRWNGRYLEFPSLGPGVQVRISFPITARWVKYRVPGAPWAAKYSIVDEDSGSGMPLPKSIFDTPPEIVEKILQPTEYAVRYRGNTIVGIEPAGTIYPFYQRAEMLEKRAPLREVKRHVPARLIPTWN